MLRPFLLVATVAALVIPSRADAVSDAAQTLRKAGFPDVSKLELRECDWNEPYFSQDKAPVAHSVFFVLDAGKKQVLGWSGLPFMVNSIGVKATEHVEVWPILQAPDDRYNGSFVGWPGFSAQPLAVVMLELNGRGDAARKLLSKTGVRPKELTQSAGGFWLHSLREDGVSAFCNPHAWVEPLVADGVETPTSGFERAKTRFQTIQSAARVLPRGPQGDLDYDAGATHILADIARRKAEGPPPTEEVPRLIWDLENVAAREVMVGAGIDWRNNQGTYQKLLRLDDKAVPALIDCFQNDTRLTLSYHLRGDSSGDTSIAPVSEVAQYAVTEIVGGYYVSTLDRAHSTPKQRRADIAAQMRANLEKLRALSSSLAPLWVPFSDPNTPAQRLLEVAEQLTRLAPHEVGIADRMHGEGLRAWENPSVSDVFERQIVRLSDAKNIGSADRLATYYAQWDPTGAAPFLGAQLKRTMAFVEREDYGVGYSWPDTQLDFLAARVRVPGEKAAALRDYGAFLHGRGFGTLRDKSYEPLARFSDDPNMRAAALELFGEGATPFQDALKRPNDFFNSTQVLTTLRGPLMQLPVLKAAVVRELANRTPIGFLIYKSPKEAAIAVTAWQMQGRATPAKLSPRREAAPSGLRHGRLRTDGRQGRRAETRLLDLAASEAARDARLTQIALLVRDGKVAFDAQPMGSIFR